MTAQWRLRFQFGSGCFWMHVQHMVSWGSNLDFQSCPDVRLGPCLTYSALVYQCQDAIGRNEMRVPGAIKQVGENTAHQYKAVYSRETTQYEGRRKQCPLIGVSTKAQRLHLWRGDTSRLKGNTISRREPRGRRQHAAKVWPSCPLKPVTGSYQHVSSLKNWTCLAGNGKAGFQEDQCRSKRSSACYRKIVARGEIKASLRTCLDNVRKP